MSASLNQLPVTARERAGLLSANAAVPETGAASSPASPATCGPAASAAGPASSGRFIWHKLDAKRADALRARLDRFAGLLAAGHTALAAAAIMGISHKVIPDYIAELRHQGVKIDIATNTRKARKARAANLAARRNAELLPKIKVWLATGRTIKQCALMLGFCHKRVGLMCREAGLTPLPAAERPKRSVKALKPVTPAPRPKRVRVSVPYALRIHDSKPAVAKASIPMLCLSCRKPFLSWDRAKNRRCAMDCDGGAW